MALFRSRSRVINIRVAKSIPRARPPTQCFCVPPASPHCILYIHACGLPVAQQGRRQRERSLFHAVEHFPEFGRGSMTVVNLVLPVADISKNIKYVGKSVYLYRTRSCSRRHSFTIMPTGGERRVQCACRPRRPFSLGGPYPKIGPLPIPKIDKN